MDPSAGDWSEINPIELPGSRSFELHSLLTFLIATLGFLILVLVQPIETLFGVPATLSGSMLAVASALVAWGSWRAFRSNRPKLVVNDQGILDRTVMGGEVFIPWDQVQEFEGDPMPSRLNIRIRDMGSVKAKGMRRWILALSHLMGPPSVPISTSSLEVDRSTLAAALEERLTQGLMKGIKRDRLNPSGEDPPSNRD